MLRKTLTILSLIGLVGFGLLWTVAILNGERTFFLSYILPGRHGWGIGIPPWFLMTILGVVWWCADRPIRKQNLRRKRKKLGRCVKCGYDLRGSEERCSECGTGISD